MSDQVAAVLTGAAAYLDRRGWVPTRTYRSSDRRMTTLQAIVAAAADVAPADVDLLEETLDAVCLDVFGLRCGTGTSVSAWDRKPDRTQARVIHDLRRMADEAAPESQ